MPLSWNAWQGHDPIVSANGGGATAVRADLVRAWRRLNRHPSRCRRTNLLSYCASFAPAEREAMPGWTISILGSNSPIGHWQRQAWNRYHFAPQPAQTGRVRNDASGLGSWLRGRLGDEGVISKHVGNGVVGCFIEGFYTPTLGQRCLTGRSGAFRRPKSNQHGRASSALLPYALWSRSSGRIPSALTVMATSNAGGGEQFRQHGVQAPTPGPAQPAVETWNR